MIRVIQGDITKINGFDAIVNSANNSLLGGGGIDGQIHRAAGPQLRTECRKLNGCETGASRLTLGYNLPCKYIIHSVGPVWMGGTAGEDSLLKDCYKSTMKIALDNKIRKIAFTPISAGEYGYPAELASEIALSVIYDFVSKNPDAFEDICFVVTDELSANVYGEQIEDILKKLEEAKQKAEAKKKAAKKPKNASVASKNKASEEEESKDSDEGEELKGIEEDDAADTVTAESDEASSDSADRPDSDDTEKEPSENETKSVEGKSEATSDDESIKDNTDAGASDKNDESANVNDEPADVSIADTPPVDDNTGNGDESANTDNASLSNPESMSDSNEPSKIVSPTAPEISETSADDTTDDTEKETEADTSETASDINISLLRSALASRAATDSGILKPWDRYDIGWLIDDIASGLPHTYACFWHANEGSENNVLSHWYRGNPIFINGRKYDTVEQYIMSERALMFNDYGSYKLIMDEPDPSKCKKYGRNIQNFDEQSWSKVFREIIFRGSVAKALSDKRFADALVATGDSVLIEASPFDDVYGAGLRKDQLFSEDGTLIIPPEEWRAYKSERQSQNIMGFVLMSVRDYIKYILTSN